MTNPVWVGMPDTDRTFNVPKAGGGHWGEIRCGGKCRDDYARLRQWDQPPAGGNPVELQGAGLESFKAADAAVHQRTGYHIVLTGSTRSCAYQTRLHNLDPSRYANPDTSAHPRGLAIDVSTNLPQRVRDAAHDELTSRGWHQARPTSEPWHYSFGLEV